MIRSHKKQPPGRKKLLLTVEQVRDLQRSELSEVAGGGQCTHSMQSGIGKTTDH